MSELTESYKSGAQNTPPHDADFLLKLTESFKSGTQNTPPLVKTCRELQKWNSSSGWLGNSCRECHYQTFSLRGFPHRARFDGYLGGNFKLLWPIWFVIQNCFQLGQDVRCFVEGDLIDGETPTDSEVIVNVETPSNWPSQGGNWFLCTIFYTL